jgi:hypothetical protein
MPHRLELKSTGGTLTTAIYHFVLVFISNLSLGGLTYGHIWNDGAADSHRVIEVLSQCDVAWCQPIGGIERKTCVLGGR